MDERHERELMMRVAWHYLGTPYIWAGDDPGGFDCSGFAVECLQAVGLLPRKGDWTAAGLLDLFRKGRVFTAEAGDLVFWRAAGDDASPVVHVEIMVDALRSIGASGGGSANTTVAEAWRRNAYIKVRPYAGRPFCAGIYSPFGGAK
ncbi:MAG: C40 family peptidase [Deltaproteobacteria bacterium]|nr:C40 family peptidase [Deltaproteobacteria bacterium]